MTTFEHAMVGVCTAVAAGWDRRFSWKVVGLAGVAAVTPDWDGLLLLGGMQLMDEAHRVWGHNLLLAAAAALLWALLDYYADVVTRLTRLVGRAVTLPLTPQQLQLRSRFRSSELAAWGAIAVAMAWLHLPCDMVVSGGAGLTDWEVLPWWPFSRQGFVLPCVPWGDVGLSVLFGSALVAMAARPAWRRPVASAALAGTVMYLAARRLM